MVFLVKMGFDTRHPEPHLLQNISRFLNTALVNWKLVIFWHVTHVKSSL